MVDKLSVLTKRALMLRVHAQTDVVDSVDLQLMKSYLAWLWLTITSGLSVPDTDTGDSMLSEESGCNP